MDNLEPITRNEMFLNGDDLEPITREEMILAGEDLEPITRHEWFLKKYRGGGGGGGYDLVNIPNLPADIASFSDGTDLPMASLKVAVTPYQDLHGYDAPWAGGAGKNKLPLTVESIKTASDKSTWNNNSITINGITYEIQVDADGNVSGIKTNGTASGDSNLRIYDGDAEFHGKTLNGCPSNGAISTYYMQLSNVSVGSDYDLGNGTDINQTDTGRWILIINIKSGTTVSNLMFKPMIRLATETDPTFAPYSNICPIIGWDKANVSVVDMLGLEIVDSWLTSIGEAHSVDGDTLIINYITPKSSDNPGTLFDDDRTVTISVDSITGVATGIKIQLLDVNNTFVGQVTNSSKTFTGVGSKIRIDYSGGGRTIIKGLQIYSNGATYTIDLNGTRYGGTLDVVSGVLTVDRAYVDLGSLNWNKYNADYSYFRNITPLPSIGYASISYQPLCSIYPYKGGTGTASTNLLDKSLYKDWNSAVYFIISDSSYGTATDFKTAMNGVQLVYELATPLTIQLTPTATKSLEGENNISANCGQITEVKYFKKA